MRLKTTARNIAQAALKVMRKDNFLDWLEFVFKDMLPSTKQLLAEMMWLLELLVQNTRAQIKRERFKTIWGWSGEALPSSKYLEDEYLTGTVNIGQGPRQYMWLELLTLVLFMREWKGLSKSEQKMLLGDGDKFTQRLDDWLRKFDDEEMAGEYGKFGTRMVRHLLNYILFPDQFERILSNASKRKIVNFYAPGKLPESASWPQIDAALHKIRSAEEKRLGKKPLDFFAPPLDSWRDTPSDDSEPIALNRIFYGPPGTGKTYHTVNAAVKICDPDFYQSNKDNRDELLDRFDQLRSDKQVEFVTFHQSFDYEYFVEGLKAETTDDGEICYEVGKGIFKRLCERAQHKEGVPHVLIIDEINRGNLSKIFGELITLLEESKRIGNKEALRATLPYSNKSFGVPANLYLIGTMNTADRSIALLDTALRRRFEFVEMMPDSSLLRDVVIDDINIAAMLDAINARIAAIYDRDHQIGHAYFMSVSVAPSVAELADVFRHKVLPLLQEYFYDDWEKIDVVLNHNKFVVADDMPPMPDNDWIDANKKLWRFDYTALYNRENYRRIYESRADDSAIDE